MRPQSDLFECALENENKYKQQRQTMLGMLAIGYLLVKSNHKLMNNSSLMAFRYHSFIHESAIGKR